MKSRFAHSLFLLLSSALMLTACAAERAKLVGRVTNSLTGVPIQGVEVTATTSSDIVEFKQFTEIKAITDSKGEYTFETALEDQSYSLLATLAGYTQTQGTVRSPKVGQSREIPDLQIQPLPRVSGVVANAISKRPLIGCAVELNGDWKAVTAEGGAFVFEAVTPGVHALKANCEDAQGQVRVNVAPGVQDLQLAEPILVLSIPNSPTGLWQVLEETLVPVGTPMPLPGTLNIRSVGRPPEDLYELDSTRRFIVPKDVVDAAASGGQPIRQGSRIAYDKSLLGGRRPLMVVPLTWHDARSLPPMHSDGSGKRPAELVAGYHLLISRIEARQEENRYGQRVSTGTAFLRYHLLNGFEKLSNGVMSLDTETAEWQEGYYCISMLKGQFLSAENDCLFINISSTPPSSQPEPAPTSLGELNRPATVNQPSPPTAGTDAMKPSAQPLEDLTSHVKASASSSLPKWKSFEFDVAKLLDGTFETSWQPNAKRSKGVGEWIELAFPKKYEIHEIQIANGFQSNFEGQDLFSANARLRAIDIEAGGRVQKVMLDPEQRGFVRITPSAPFIGDKVRLTVTAVHDGTRWPDLAVSEIRVLGRASLPD